MREQWHTFWNDDSGQGLVEYALIIALIAVALVVTLTAFRGKIASVFDTIGNELDSAGGTSSP